jgi:hypothetical protein
VDWSRVAQDMYQWRALVNTAMNVWIAWKTGHFMRATVGLWIRTLLHVITKL